jgi:hypothetical protein
VGIPRLQLVELEDQPWLPRLIRDLATDYLRFVEERFQLHLHALPILERALEAGGTTRIVDLCSGGAGPVPHLVRDLSARGVDVRATLTDLYPNVEAFQVAERGSDGRIEHRADSVDARTVPTDLAGLRTFFNAFHHFAPGDARDILQAAVDAGQPIAVLEVPERSLRSILPLLLTPLFVWLATPFIRPFRWSRLLWTYPLPAVPLLCLWDGIVSQLRAYRPDELRALAKATGDSFTWEAGVHRAPKVPGQITYLLGWPRGSAHA